MTGTVFRLGDHAPARAARMPSLDPGHLHEIHAQPDDRAAALAFALGRGGTGKALLVRLARRGRRTVPSGEGLVLLGIDPARLVLVEAGDERDLLRAGLEAARCPGIGLVLLETRGRCPGYDLTASRRLALAARRSRTSVVVLRHEAEPRPSVAQTRWAVAAAPSRALDGGAPGWPAL
ncbi:MAG: ImuA family protein, partial [Novosphingobium sp.]